MRYIKKEELIESEIYKVQESSFSMIGLITLVDNGNNDLCSKRGNATYITTKNEFRKDSCWCYISKNRNIIKATPEEKHWLNTCIKQDKFITFEEAIKTFIPEYVECINTSASSAYTLNKIYKIIDKTTYPNCISIKCDKNIRRDIINWNENFIKDNHNCFKPSTKEAYDAQFVVKEPEFVLPEKWCVLRNKNNYIAINKWCNENHLIGEKPPYMCDTKTLIYSKQAYNSWTMYKRFSYTRDTSFTEITFEQFKKYVLKEETVEEVKIIEPLPQFKIIETIETITKVENNEGNQFFIGDTVKSLNSNQKDKIVEFKYSSDKSNIIAITTFQQNNGIGINKIEHYIEPKTNYEILEYKTEGGISCKAPFLQDSHQFYINEKCKIYSIKRISDNLIITVGDNVLSKTCGVPNKILSIELINNKIRLYPRNSFYNLEDILKINNK